MNDKHYDNFAEQEHGSLKCVRRLQNISFFIHKLKDCHHILLFIHKLKDCNHILLFIHKWRDCRHILFHSCFLPVFQ